MIKITPIDDAAAKDGVWRSYRGVQLLIARMDNPRYVSCFKRLSAPYKHDLGAVDESIASDIMAQSLAEGVLLSWKPFDVDGQSIEYSKENAKELLKNDPDCMAFIQTVSGDLNNYLIEEQQALVGES